LHKQVTSSRRGAQLSFKHLIKQQYEDWATTEIFNQIQNNLPIKLSTTMGIVKPKVLEWCHKSWQMLENRPELIMAGWIKCMNNIRDPFDHRVQEEAFEKVLRNQLEAYGFVPEGEEKENVRQYYSCITDSDSDKDELDVLKRRVFGERKSKREKIITIVTIPT
jgi:hypothetical protein